MITPFFVDEVVKNTNNTNNNENNKYKIRIHSKGWCFSSGNCPKYKKKQQQKQNQKKKLHTVRQCKKVVSRPKFWSAARHIADLQQK